MESSTRSAAKPLSDCCRCECGYRCGGPGVCKAGLIECIEKHFVRDCDHDFSGPMVQVGERERSVLCQKCGMSAMGHDCMVGP